MLPNSWAPLGFSGESAPTRLWDDFSQVRLGLHLRQQKSPFSNEHSSLFYHSSLSQRPWAIHGASLTDIKTPGSPRKQKAYLENVEANWVTLSVPAVLAQGDSDASGARAQGDREREAGITGI